MKKFIVINMVNFFFLSAWAQDVRVRVAEVQFNTTSQDGINLSGTYGENIVGSGSNEGIIIVHGFYSGIMADSITAIGRIEPIEGLKAFPNPTRDGLILSSDDNAHSAYQVRLISETSILLLELDWRSGEDQVNMDLVQIPAGLYFITVKEEKSGRQSTMKIIRQ